MPKKAATKKPLGRPTTYTRALADEICERIAKGETCASICRSEHMPQYRTVTNWTNAHPEFKEAYGRARDEGYDVIAAGCLDIADDGTNDWMEQKLKDGSTTIVFNGEHVQRSKLRIETRLKLLAKWDPRRYGDKHILAGDPENPVKFERIERVIVDGPDSED